MEARAGLQFRQCSDGRFELIRLSKHPIAQTLMVAHQLWFLVLRSAHWAYEAYCYPDEHDRTTAKLLVLLGKAPASEIWKKQKPGQTLDPVVIGPTFENMRRRVVSTSKVLVTDELSGEELRAAAKQQLIQDAAMEYMDKYVGEGDEMSEEIKEETAEAPLTMSVPVQVDVDMKVSINGVPLTDDEGTPAEEAPFTPAKLGADILFVRNLPTPEGQPTRQESFAAKVSRVWSETSINLGFLNFDGTPGQQTSVTYNGQNNGHAFGWVYPQ